MDTGIDNLIMAQHEASHRRHRQNRLLIVAAGVILLLAGVLAGSAMTAKGWLAFGSGGGKVPIYLASDQHVNQAVNLNNGFSAVAKRSRPPSSWSTFIARQSPAAAVAFIHGSIP